MHSIYSKQSNCTLYNNVEVNIIISLLREVMKKPDPFSNSSLKAKAKMCLLT